MTPSEIADNRTDLLTFIKTMFKVTKGADFKDNFHQKLICEELEKVVIGKTKRLIINIPPRSGKTYIAVIGFIAWCAGNFPDSEFIHASYSKRLATNNTYQARSLMQHEKYAEIFGKPEFKQDSNAKDEFRTEDGGIFYSTGNDGSITGYGAGKMRDYFGGCLLVDDPHKAGEANSEVMRNNVLDWFSTTLESRKNSPDTPIIVIMQRLHENDLSGFLLGGGNGEEWKHLNIPAVNEDGSSFWEEQFPLQDLKRLEATNSYRFAGQYMQRPSPIGGGIFKDSWWQYYKVLPRISYRIMYADTAQKTKEQNDFSVFQCWGIGEDKKIYLLDMIRGKWESPELLIFARNFFKKNKAIKNLGTLRQLKVEDKSSGTGLIQQLQRENLTVVGIKRNIDKVTRALDVAPQIQAGNVFLPEEEPFINDILIEASGFPNATHDDTLDPLMDAISDMLIENQRIDYSKLI